MNELRDIIKNIAKLKPIPQVVNKILEIQQDPQKGIDELTRVIEHDPMVTANLLKAANCAYYARSKPIESVHQATVFLGMDEVVDLVLMSNISSNLKRPQKGYGLEAGELWRNCISSALLSRQLSHRMNHPNPHLIFTGALLKDIGKVILDQYVETGAKDIHRLVEQEGMSFEEAEKKVIGIDHAELGALTAVVWRFSPEMADIIKYHHDPGNAGPSRNEAAIVHLSDTLCMMMGIGTGSDGLAHRSDQKTITAMGLNNEDIQLMMAGFADKLEKIEALIAIN